MTEPKTSPFMKETQLIFKHECNDAANLQRQQKSTIAFYYGVSRMSDSRDCTEDQRVINVMSVRLRAAYLAQAFMRRVPYKCVEPHRSDSEAKEEHFLHTVLPMVAYVSWVCLEDRESFTSKSIEDDIREWVFADDTLRLAA